VVTVSVVIPTLNEEKNIGECLDMLLPQRPDEVVVVDHSSDDHTAEIAKLYGARVYTLPHSATLGELRQFGAEFATRDIVATTDADARPPLGWIDRIRHRFSAEPDLMAIYGSVHDSSGNALKTAWASFMPAFCPGTAANCAFRRDAFLRSDGYPAVMRGEDTAMFRNMAAVGRVAFDPKLTMGMELKDYWAGAPIVAGAIGYTLFKLFR